MTDRNKNDPNQLWIEDTYAGTYSDKKDESFAVFWHTSVGSVNDAAAFMLSKRTIEGDGRRSDRAKVDDVREKALATLRELQKRQADLTKAVDGLDAERRSLAKIPAADVPTTLVDLAMAEQFRALTGDQRNAVIADLTSGVDGRLVEMILRTPLMLTGLSPQMRDVIASRAIERSHPQAVNELQQRSEAARTAQDILTRATEHVVKNSNLTMQDIVGTLGAQGFDFVGAAPRDPILRQTLAERYAATKGVQVVASSS
jgi:hypothetical protein